MNRRAQGIGINIVIIAAIALLVLLIVAMIVTQSGGEVREGLDRCVVNGGQCYGPAEAPVGYTQIQGNCPEQGEQCYAAS